MVLTELLLDDLQNLLLVKLLGETLNCSQSLTSITLCNPGQHDVAPYLRRHRLARENSPRAETV